MTLLQVPSAHAIAWQRAVARARALLDGDVRPAPAALPRTLFDELAAGWRLDAVDRDIVAVVAAVALDVDLATAFAAVFGMAAPTAGTLAQMITSADVVLRCTSDSRLRRAGLIDVDAIGVRAVVTPSRRLVGLLEDRMVLHATVAEVAALLPTDAACAGGVTCDPPFDVLIALCDALQQQRDGRGPISLVGEPRSGRLRTALAIAAELEHRRALVVDAALVAADPGAWRVLASQLISEASFHVAPVIVRDGGPAALAAATRIAQAGLPCFVTTTDEPRDGRCRVQARVIRPTVADRLTAWQHEAGAAAWASEDQLARLALDHVLSRSEIATTAGLAAACPTDDAAHWIDQAARGQQRSRLDRFARPVSRRVRLDEIVLSHAVAGELGELIAALRARPLLAQTWDLARALQGSNGVAALFDGPPGTGKTLSAAVVATELDVPLYRIEVSTIVDRYVGETEKNLTRLFREAEASRGILLFDEADSLFSRRVESKDAMDRFANMQVNQLLTLIEEYPGISILTTNLKQGLDVAFSRRIAYKLEFDLPDEAERIALWQMYLPPGQLAPREIAHLADRFDRVSGAEIRNAVLRAASIAITNGRIVLEHVVRSLVAELQSAGSVISMGGSR